MGYELHIEILKTYDGAMIEDVIPHPRKSMKSCRENLAHGVTLCSH
jgi:hypothetical protein